MSGALSVISGLINKAYWRLVPLSVLHTEDLGGRKVAPHNYPFRDSSWPEDMGRAPRHFRLYTRVQGTFGPALVIAARAVCEVAGPGLLIHPAFGAVQAQLLNYQITTDHTQQGAVYLNLEFQEATASVFPAILTSTIGNVLSSINSAINSVSSYISGAVAAIGIGIAAVGVISGIVGLFTSSASNNITRPDSILSLATSLPPPDDVTSYGRYAEGNLGSGVVPDGTSVATLQANLAANRAAVAAAQAALAAACAGLSLTNTGTLVTAANTFVQATLACAADPAAQVRSMLSLASFSGTVTTATSTSVGLDAKRYAAQVAMTAMLRRVALAGVATACTNYVPQSYNDAYTLMMQVAAAFDREITAAGDAGDDPDYLALRALRTAVVNDLQARGANLPYVVTITTPVPIPSLALAQRTYRDATREDELIAEGNPIHPAFMPPSLQVLAS